MTTQTVIIARPFRGGEFRMRKDLAEPCRLEGGPEPLQEDWPGNKRWIGAIVEIIDAQTD